MGKKTIKSIASIILITVLVTAFSGCGENNHTQVQTGIAFTDALGRNVAIEKTPQRVATLIGSFADIWMLSGGTVCATVDDAWDDFGLDLPDAVNIGGAHSPNLELILSANPDFVIASASTSADVKMQSALEAAGITVAYFDVDNFYDYLKMLDICTDITGRKDLYKQNGTDVEIAINSIKQSVNNAALSEEKRTVLLLRAHSGSVKAKGSTGTVLGEMLKDLGCINIADGNTALLENLSVETIIQKNPYHIFAVSMGNDTDKAFNNLRSMMQENPAWNTLDAVKNGRLHLMDRKLFNIKPNAKWADSYEKLSDILLEKN